MIRVLGRGAFGIVYLSHDADLDRDVAIKVPVGGPSSLSLDVESYLEEARTLARLSHPNIVPVYDVGHIPGGCYVVSKYMEGGDLAARLRQGRPAFVESAELIADPLRGASLHPRPRPVPPGYQAGEHPARRGRGPVSGRLRAGAEG